MGAAVGLAACGYILTYYGYVANEVQTKAALFGIILAMTAGPIISAIASLSAMIFYPLNDKKILEIEKVLEARRNGTIL